jgi:YVTN family beta-propeller protein
MTKNTSLSTIVMLVVTATGIFSQGSLQAQIATEQAKKIPVNSVETTLPVGGRPWGVTVAADSKSVYAADSYSNELSIIDASNNSVTATVYADSPVQPLLTKNGKILFVTDQEAGTITGINTSTHGIECVYGGFGEDLLGMALTPNGKELFIASYKNATLGILDAQNGHILSLLGGLSPAFLAITPDGRTAYYTAPEQGMVVRVNVARKEIEGDPISVGTYPTSITISQDGRKAFVGNSESSSISVIDTKTQRVIDTIGLANNPGYQAALTPNGDYLYLVVSNGPGRNEPGYLTMIDTKHDTVVGNPLEVGNGPSGVAVAPNGERAYVTNMFDGTVSVIAIAE